MNDWAKMTKEAKKYKEMYPAGTRVVLNSMNDPWAPVTPGTRGTVDHVEDIGTIHMRWDNGRTLGLVPGEDSFRKLTAKELEEEKKASLDDVIKSAETKCAENQVKSTEMSRDESEMERR